jgi:hypothetical protein
MFTKHQAFLYLRYSIAAAILYLISVIVFLSVAAYSQTYILYIGNVLFAVPIVFFIVNFAKKRNENANTRMAIKASVITTVMGMILSVLCVFIILAIMKPSGYSDVANTASELAKPAPTLKGNGHPLMLILVVDAIFGNLGTGIFIAMMLPNMIKSDQSGETAVINPVKSER